jgi:glutaredoxin
MPPNCLLYTFEGTITQEAEGIDVPYHEMVTSRKGKEVISMAKKVILYTQKTCAPCQEEKIWLTQQGVAFEDRDIRANETYLNEVINLGASATPVTVIEKEQGEQVVVFGFDRDKLKEALNLP